MPEANYNQVISEIKTLKAYQTSFVLLEEMATLIRKKASKTNTPQHFGDQKEKARIFGKGLM